MIKKLFAVLCVVAGALAFPVPVFAAIAAPDTFQINSVQVYQHCFEEDDQLYIIDLEGSYAGANPAEGTAQELFLVRLMDGATELRASTIYAYFDDGYDRNVVVFYFADSDTDKPTWADNTLTVKFQGNPTYDWADPATVTGVTTTIETSFWKSEFDSLAETHNALLARVRTLASTIESAWGDLTNYDLIVPSSSGNVLTTVGAGYFSNVFPSLRTLLPEIFIAAVSAPDITQREYSHDYGESWRDNMGGLADGFDHLATVLTNDMMTGIQISSFMWIAIWAIACVIAMGSFRRLPFPPMLGMAFIMGISTIIGAWLGFVHYIYMGLMVFLCFFLGFFGTRKQVL